METNRLIIRKFIDDDFEDFFDLIVDKMQGEFAVYDEQFPTSEYALNGIFNFFKESPEFFAVELKEKNKVIGFCSLNKVDDETLNLGYSFHYSYHHQGYGFEACEALLNVCRQNPSIRRIVAGTAKNNVPSVKLLKKLDFQIKEESLSSFTKDSNGQPLTFTSYGFELKL